MTAFPSRSSERSTFAGRRQVCIVQTYLPHYRVPLLELLRSKLESSNVDLHLVHGLRDPSKPDRADEGRLSWSKTIECFRPLGSFSPFLWQPVARFTSKMDLVIATQENRLLHNHWLLFRRRFNQQQVAFWGHGRNFQANPSWRESLRRWQIRQPDWWFGYTSSSRKAVLEAGFPASKITVLENATDTRSLRQHLRAVTTEDLQNFRAQTGIPHGPTGVFCSSLHPGKRIDFLLAAAHRVRAVHPNFQLIIVGAGPEFRLIEESQKSNSWIHWLGPLFGKEKAVALRLASVFLMPYFVGLSMLDALCAGLPMIAIRPPDGNHSPEIDYLEHGRNGLLTDPSVESFAKTVGELLSNTAQITALGKQAEFDSGKYTIEQMTMNFHDGILSALKQTATGMLPEAPNFSGTGGTNTQSE